MLFRNRLHESFTIVELLQDVPTTGCSSSEVCAFYVKPPKLNSLEPILGL